MTNSRRQYQVSRPALNLPGRAMRLAAVCIMLACGVSTAGTFAPGTGPRFTEADIEVLRTSGQKVVINGQEKVLIGDQLFAFDELSAKAFEGRAWSGGTLVYEFYPQVAGNPIWTSAFTGACAMWSDVAPNVRCRRRTGEATYVSVRTHTTPACVSYVDRTGMGNGEQVLSVFHDPTHPRCGSHWAIVGLIAHEIGHAFGLVHEQKRWDRPSYLQVFLQNLTDPSDPRLVYQYALIPGTAATSYTPYDFNSIMHYRATDNAKLGTVVMAPSTCFEGEVSYIGTRDLVSASDALEMRHHYGLPIYEMLRERRDPSCGSVRVNPSERKHFCQDLGENCGSGAGVGQHSAVTGGHRTWWCPGSFSATCGGVGGPQRSCCTVAGKEPFDVSHRRGRRDCTVYTQRRHESTWNCGCPYYTVNARCASATFGFNQQKVTEYLQSRDTTLRTLGRFAVTIMSFEAGGLLGPQTLVRLEDVLIQQFGMTYYNEALTETRRKLEVMRHVGAISTTKPLTRERLHKLLAESLRRVGQCGEEASLDVVKARANLDPVANLQEETRC